MQRQKYLDILSLEYKEKKSARNAFTAKRWREEREKTATSCQTENSASETKQESNHLVGLPVLSHRRKQHKLELFQDQNDIYGKFYDVVFFAQAKIRKNIYHTSNRWAKELNELGRIDIKSFQSITKGRKQRGDCFRNNHMVHRNRISLEEI